ncbi:hypothetical protein BJ138DRAFT_1104692 [Hygrophoropsis aurantiaca]|uniref:Uncharacterized protein n=1 Tax=Hygrophoropsis aurantiaca TaxID=72124 RepID=A0ACB8A1R1_9AGAM|nr:hypothetical protein BJ138DRAFT_1104692 [Hygrophoropsis aurantiaca]
MQLSFASLLSLVVLVTSVQALPAQEKRSPLDPLGIAYQVGDDAAAATAASVEKRSPANFRFDYPLAVRENDAAAAAAGVEKRSPANPRYPLAARENDDAAATAAGVEKRLLVLYPVAGLENDDATAAAAEAEQYLSRMKLVGRYAKEFPSSSVSE